MQEQGNDELNMNSQQRKANKKGGAGNNRTKLIINYIPQFATEEELTNIFAQVGQIENIRIVKHCCTGYNIGYGFVTYVMPEHAAAAIAVINGMNFRSNTLCRRNKRLKVSYSRRLGKESDLYITNLPENVTEEDIDRMFGEFGEIIHRTILKEKVTGVPQGAAFVRFVKTAEAKAAIAALDGQQLENAMLPLSIRVAYRKHNLTIP